MFDFTWSEIALIVVVALVFIGPKDMPVAIRAVSRGIKSLRKMASEFQTHVDDMVRDADLGEAREHFRDLRKFDVRGQFMRAIDSDGSLRGTVNTLESPRRDPQPAPGFVPPLPAPEHVPGIEVTHPEPVEMQQVPAPAILPPTIARRVHDERIRRMAPHIVPPPRAFHGGKRVPLTTTPGDA